MRKELCSYIWYYDEKSIGHIIGHICRTWKKQVEEESVKVGLRREDALCRSKWSAGMIQIAVGLSGIRPPSLVGKTTRLLTLVCLSPINTLTNRICFTKNITYLKIILHNTEEP